MTLMLGQFGHWSFDGVNFTKTLDRILGQAVREAAREWLRAVLQTGIPVETGMAKAALVPVGRFIGNIVRGEGSLYINPTRKPYYSKLEGGRQSIELGEAKSFFSIRDDQSHPMEFIYKFEWSTDVQHYWLSQFYNGSAVSGEQANEAGAEAFQAWLAYIIPRRIPKLEGFMGDIEYG